MAKVSEQVSEDSKKMQDLAQEFKEELDSLVSENTKEAAPE
jgi:phasin family protein